MELKNPDKIYQTTQTLVYSCQFHVIFCTKYRRKVLQDGIDERFKQLVTEKQPDYHYIVIEMEVMPDHVHLLLDICPTENINLVVSHIKGYAANILRKEYPSLVSRLPALWSRSRFISSVGAVSLEIVKQYIENQKGK
jgi:putative transposase